MLSSVSFAELLANPAFRTAYWRWWRFQDWSWDGLARKPRRRRLNGEDDPSLGSLQDAWRAEEPRLIEFQGRRWTRFHLPPFYHPFVDAERRNWIPRAVPPTLCPDDVWQQAKNMDCVADLQKMLSRWNKIEASGVEDYGDLRGVVFPPTFHHRGNELVGNFGSSIFLGGLFFSGTVRARFGFTLFCAEVALAGSKFSGDTRFADATFCDGVSFAGAEFDGMAQFTGAVFCSSASFHGTRPFRGGASFSKARFFKGCDFTNCEFGDSTDFSGARFDGLPRFNQAKLHSDTDFSDVRFSSGEAPKHDWWPYPTWRSGQGCPVALRGRLPSFEYARGASSIRCVGYLLC